MSKMLNVGEWFYSDQSIEYVCYGLGSCVSIFITDKRRTFTGGAHISLPSTSKTSGWEGADCIIEEVLRGFKNRGYLTSFLEAKIAGGSKITSGESLNVGHQNIQSVVDILNKYGIKIISKDVGGQSYRTVRYRSDTGELVVSSLDNVNYII